MTLPTWILVGAAICLGVVVLTLLVIVFTLRRGSQVIREKLESEPDSDSQPVESSIANTRWARGDLKAAPEALRPEVTMIPCPACGGENPTGASSCAFCGRKL